MIKASSQKHQLIKFFSFENCQSGKERRSKVLGSFTKFLKWGAETFSDQSKNKQFVRNRCYRHVSSYKKVWLFNITPLFKVAPHLTAWLTEKTIEDLHHNHLGSLLDQLYFSSWISVLHDASLYLLLLTIYTVYVYSILAALLQLYTCTHTALFYDFTRANTLLGLWVGKELTSFGVK